MALVSPAPVPSVCVSAIIVNYNSGALLPACVTALRGAGEESLEILIVDNGSTDGSLDAMLGAGVRVIRAGRNLGFSRANNLGARAARGRYLLLLNTDCFVQPGLLPALLAALRADPGAAVAGPRLLNADGTLQPSCHNFPTPGVLFLEQSLLWRPIRRAPALRERLQIASAHARPRRVDWLAGACLLVRADSFAAVGGFDEGYFFYWEEADLCLRLQARGGAAVFAPAATAIHLGGGSSRDPTLLRQFFRSLYRFYARHYDRPRLILARAIVLSMALLKAGRAAPAALRGAPDARATLRSWLAVARL
jgi:GT2 family glycosyltransferase